MNPRNQKIQKIVELGSIIQKTGLHEKEDFFFLKDLKNRTKSRKNPNDYVLIVFTKARGIPPAEKKSIVSDFLKKQNIEVQEPIMLNRPEAKLYVNHSMIELKPIVQVIKEKSDLISTVKETEKKKKIEEYESGLKILAGIHGKLLLLGVQNLDQKFLQEGFANFNYINEGEMNLASEKLLKLGIESFSREDKPCNLTFLLSFKPIKKLKLKTKKRSIKDEDAIPTATWILKKIFRKNMSSFIPTEGSIAGISTRGIVACPKSDLLKIQDYLKENFNICILIESGDDKKAEFFVLNSKRAKEIHEERNGRIVAREMIKELEIKTEIKHKPIQRKGKNMNRISPLSKEVTDLLSGNEFKYSSYGKKGVVEKKDQIYLTHKKLKGGFKICLSRGTKEEKISIAKLVLHILQNSLGKKADFVLSNTKTRISVLEKTEINQTPKRVKKTPAAKIKKVVSKKMAPAVGTSTFLSSLSVEQKLSLIDELGVETLDIASVVEKISKNFLFINKKSQFAAGFSKQVFAKIKEVISKTSGK